VTLQGMAIKTAASLAFERNFGDNEAFSVLGQPKKTHAKKGSSTSPAP
jgi:hypothetical protein